MSIKLNIKPGKKPPLIEYPVLKQDKNGCIVLFTQEDYGFCIVNPKHDPDNYKEGCYNEADYNLFNGRIILENI